MLFVRLEVSQSPKLQTHMIVVHKCVCACVCYSGLCFALCFNVVLAVNFIAKYYNTRGMIYVSVIVYMCTNERSALIHFIAVAIAIAIVLCVRCCGCCSLTHKHTLNSLLLYRSDI